MSALIEVILPVFIVIGFGYAAVWLKLFSEDAVDGVMRFSQNFAVPCLLFKGVAELDLANAFQPGLFASFYIGAFSAFTLGALGARYLFHRTGPESVAIGFCCLFSNSLLLGLPIMERAYGTEALSGNYAIISIHAPTLYAFGITVMEIVRHHGKGLSIGQLAAQIGGGIIRNPLVIGLTLGFAVNMSGIALPIPAWAAIDMMANDVETGIRFEKRIENMDSLTRRGGDDLRMEWSISPRDRRVELDDRAGPVTAVGTAGDFAAIAKMNMLSVRRRYSV